MPLNLSGTVLRPCYNSDNGGITLIVTGGTPAYTYLWSTGATTQHLSNVPEGTYYVTVTDSLGETGTAAYLIGELEPITIEFEINQALGNIIAVPTGGDGTYTYLWSTGSTSNQITGVAPGEYCVTVMSGEQSCRSVACTRILSQAEIDIFVFKCCAGKLGYKYVRELQTGQKEEAACDKNRLVLINGYIEDLCQNLQLKSLRKTQATQLFDIPVLPTNYDGIEMVADGDTVLNISSPNIADQFSSLLQAMDYLVVQLLNAGYTASIWARPFCTDATTFQGYFRLNTPCNANKCVTFSITATISASSGGGTANLVTNATIGCPVPLADCLTDAQIEDTTEKAVTLCGCDCNDIFNDTLIK